MNYAYETWKGVGEGGELEVTPQKNHYLKRYRLWN